jgi:hypothetical protein
VVADFHAPMSVHRAQRKGELYLELRNVLPTSIAWLLHPGSKEKGGACAPEKRARRRAHPTLTPIPGICRWGRP